MCNGEVPAYLEGHDRTVRAGVVRKTTAAAKVAVAEADSEGEAEGEGEAKESKGNEGE